MTCWSILKIDPTEDKKIIKRAYATLLKVTRPDDDIIAFQELHIAYKEALSGDYFDSGNSKDFLFYDEDTEKSEKVKIGAFNLEELEKEEFHIGIDDNNIYAYEHCEIKNDTDEEYSDKIFLRKSSYFKNKILKISNDTKQMYNVKAWEFLNESKMLYNLELKEEISIFIFDIIVEYHRIDNGLQKFIPESVITYLNSLFHWTEIEYFLEQNYTTVEIESVLNYVYKPVEAKVDRWVDKKFINKKKNAIWFLFKRTYAKFIDIVIFVIISVLLINEIEDRYGEILGNKEIYCALGIYIIIISLMEVSVLKASPGKLSMGLQVSTYRGGRMSMLQGFSRTILSSILIAYPMLIISVIFILLNLKKKKLIHDYMTFTEVVTRS